MKSHFNFLFIVLFLLISKSNPQKLETIKYTSTPTKINTNNWTEMLNHHVKCENWGILKNFIMKKNNTHFWYEYECYATKNNPEGDAIMKNFMWIIIDVTKRTYSNSITNFKGMTLNCFVDYGMVGFFLYTEEGYFRWKSTCIRIKPSYVGSLDKTGKTTKSQTGNYKTIDALANILVGNTDEETETDIAYPLRGFKVNVDTSKSSSNPSVSFKYSYSKVRNMKTVKESFAKKFEELRKKNTD